MRPIPIKMRTEMSKDKFMARCVCRNLGGGFDCSGKVEWEHAFLYAGKQINEPWAIVPVCTYHHRGKGLNKEFNQYQAIIRADIDDLCRRMPKKDWQQIYNYLTSKYEK